MRSGKESRIVMRSDSRMGRGRWRARPGQGHRVPHPPTVLRQPSGPRRPPPPGATVNCWARRGRPPGSARRLGVGGP